MANAIKKFTKSDYKRGRTALPVNAFLLEPGNKYRTDTYKSEDWNYILFAKVFHQEHVKKEREKDKYLCEYCNGTGMQLFATDEGRKAFMSSIDYLSKSEIDELVKKVNRSWSGYGTPTPEEALKYIYDGITNYVNFAKELQKAKSINDLRTKDVDSYVEDAQAKKYYKKVKKIFTDTSFNIRQIIRKSMNLQTQYSAKAIGDPNKVLEACPWCRGSGYYDIGHMSYFGKQTDSMAYLYEKYIEGNRDKFDTAEELWNQEVDYNDLKNHFLAYNVRPELAKPFPPTHKHEWDFSWEFYISSVKENQNLLFTALSSQSKKKFYERMAVERENDEKGLVGDARKQVDYVVTVGQLYNLFAELYKTAPRGESGKLKEYLRNQMKSFSSLSSTLRSLAYGKEADGSLKIPYMANYVVIEGPPRIEAEPYRKFGSKGSTAATQKEMYEVYARRYINTDLYGADSAFKKPDSSYRAWSTKSFKAILEGIFGNAKLQELIKLKFFRFFPNTRLSGKA